MERGDLQGEVRTPRHISRFLLRIGGRNPFNEANWRLIWAKNRMEWRGGEICTWPDETDLESCGGLKLDDYGKVSVSEYKPLRREATLIRVPKFPDDASWILELWFPAHKYGSPEKWAGTTRDPKTGILMLGPYPKYGDYEVQASFGPEIPGMDGLQSLIQKYNWAMVQKRGSLEDRIRQRLNEAQEEAEKLEKQKMDQAIARIHEKTSILFSTSLEAARVRNEWAKKAGVKSHVGA